MLTAALQEQATWEQRRRSAKELLNEMLASRREAAELAKSYDTRCALAAQPKPHRPGLACGCALRSSMRRCFILLTSILTPRWTADLSSQANDHILQLVYILCAVHP